jgi:hypothetical protein
MPDDVVPEICFEKLLYPTMWCPMYGGVAV